MCRCLRRSDSNDMICSFRSFTLSPASHDYVAVAQDVEDLFEHSLTSLQIVEEHEVPVYANAFPYSIIL